MSWEANVLEQAFGSAPLDCFARRKSKMLINVYNVKRIVGLHSILPRPRRQVTGVILDLKRALLSAQWQAGELSYSRARGCSSLGLWYRSRIG